ncbi:MAG: hypothetical protein LBH43_15635 [Treponema sp.]|jgi:hypothetical protein|nr:hypothetical protein [Treponema sp.]
MKTNNLCPVCADRLKRGFENKPCAAGYCPYQHLGFFDPVEWETASIRNAMKSIGIKVA